MSAREPTKHALSGVHKGIAREIACRLTVIPFHKGDTLHSIAGKKSIAIASIFDTGATRSVISEKIAKTLGLVPVGQCSVGTAGGRVIQKMYMVHFVLPNQVIIGGMEVTSAPLPNIDALIGMDIITLGDFAISSYKGNTFFSFQIPSTHCIDFCTD